MGDVACGSRLCSVGAWLVIDYCIKYYKEYNKSKEE